MRFIAEIELSIDIDENISNEEKEAMLGEVFESGCDSCHAYGNIKVIEFLGEKEV